MSDLPAKTVESMIFQPENIGMITIRADLSDAKTCNQINDATGLDIPAQRHISGGHDNGLAWMSPDELLLFCDDKTSASQLAEKITMAISAPNLVVDMSGARVLTLISGPHVREILAKGAPIDLAPESFQIHNFRRTRLGQVPVALWQEQQSPDVFGLVCFASVREYLHQWLETASRPDSMPEYWP